MSELEILSEVALLEDVPEHGLVRSTELIRLRHRPVEQVA